VLADADRWLWSRATGHDYETDVPDHLRESLWNLAWPVADAEAEGLPSWEELSRAEREILVCAAELSGYLTGPFGILPDPPADLDAPGLAAWVDEELASLLPFVRKDWIEVRHVPDPDGFAYSVIPIERLRDAFCDLGMRYQGDEWGVGFTCVFTVEGFARWRAGWSEAWHRRLRFD
jgi:hypothetical protein